MEEIVYEAIDENEILPELEIEEVLTLDQMLAYQPRFVAFSEQDILAYLHQLLKSTTQRTEAFARLHREVVYNNNTKSTHHDITKRVMITPHGLTRKDFEDSDFGKEMDEAKQASSYTVQQMGIDRVMFPFSVEADSSTIHNRPIIDTDASIELRKGAPSRILKTDPAQVPIQSARWKVSNAIDHPDYVFDTKLPSLPEGDLPDIVWNAGEEQDLSAWIMKRVRPSIEGIVNLLNEPIDVHNLHRILKKYGHDLNELNVKDFEILQKRLRDVLEANTAADEEGDQSASTPLISPANFTKTFVENADIIKNEAARAVMLTGDDQSMRLQEAYRILLQTIPPLPQQLPLSSPAELAKELRSGMTNIESVAEQLIQWYLRWFLDNLSRYMERYADTRVDLEAVENYIRDMKAVGDSIVLTTTFDFINQYSDVAEVKEGNDTSMYDGAPSIVPETVFEENENEEYVQHSIVDDDEDALAIVSNDNATNENSGWVDMGDVEPGQKEVFTNIWKQIHTIHVASGLPIDASSILRWSKQYVTRSSRVQQVMESVPGITEAIATRVIHDDLQTVSERIQDLHSKQWRDALQHTYKAIHDEWQRAMDDAMILVMTRWWIELCDQSLRGTLLFTPLRGMIQHLHTWASYGPPMQPNAKSGILFYLTEVAETALRMDARSTREKMTALASERMQKDVDELTKKWVQLQASERVLTQSDRARLLLENTIKSLKSGQGGVDILGGYLPGLLYLPQLLPAKRTSKKAASWIQGCCATPLDESFKADNDWRTQLSALYKIKRFLSKERWSVQPRIKLNGFEKEAVASSLAASSNSCAARVITTQHLKDSEPASELFRVSILDDEAWQWIPRSHIDMLTRSPNQVEGWVKTVIDKMYPGEKPKSTLVFRVISRLTSISSATSFLSRIGKNVFEMTRRQEIADMLSQMKSCLRSLPSGKVSSNIIMYVCTVAISLPAAIDHGSLTLPADVTRQEVTSIWNKNYQVCTEWNSVGFMMNTADVQAFITKVREQQKEISLQRLDILSVEDRQTLLDAKNLGLLRIVEFSEIDPDRDMDMEGEQEFAMMSGDADPHMDVL